MMKRKSAILYSFLSMLFLLFAVACSPVRVLDTEAEEDFHLSDYKTFDFYDVEASGVELEPYALQLDHAKLEITRQLEQRGLSRSAAEPDLKINLGVVVAEKVQTRETSILTDPPFYMGQRRYTWKSEEVVVSRYRQGTLSMHLVDSDRNELVWQGAAEGVIPKDDSERLQERIDAGIQKLIQEIPR